MRVYDILAKKRDGMKLCGEEIAFLVEGYTAGTIPDYQMAAFLMAVFFRGMDAEETAVLTAAMARSGDMVDLSPLEGIKADKHSTGGVGDKTTLVVAPLCAACGIKVAKMSGRGLGHTGGTVDKMEAIPGMKTTLSREQFIQQVNGIGLAVIGQSGNLAPADKKMYALRDVTATVNSIPLIASSIMSKKLAAGSDVIVLDVKTGTGAFMKTLDDSIALARTMVDIGHANGRRCAALVTDMNIPLGYNIGNSLEVAEAAYTLRGEGPKDLQTVCIELCAAMLQQAGQGDMPACRERAEAALHSGSGLARLQSMVEAQGGDPRFISNPAAFAEASVQYEVKAPQSGYIAQMDAEQVGIASMLLGAGRETKEDSIDYAAGIKLRKKTGEYVDRGEVLAVFATASGDKARKAQEVFLSALRYAGTAPTLPPLVLARVDKDGVYRYDTSRSSCRGPFRQGASGKLFGETR